MGKAFPAATGQPLDKQWGLHSAFESNRILLLVLLMCFSVVYECRAQEDTLKPVAEEIRFEACLPNQNVIGRPLPLAAHWNTGQLPGGFSPDYQIGMIEKGHYLLPWFTFPVPGENAKYEYFEKGVKKAVALKLPVSFISTQWESMLSTNPEFSKLPLEKNPNVVDVNGKVLSVVCPFGPVEPWREAGRRWTSTPTIKKLEVAYPDPPLVIFISNNEHGKLQWKDAEGCLRYLARYGKGKDDLFKRRVIGDGWIERYRALQDGMRSGLTEKSWKEKAVFIGYGAFGGSAFARWGGWINYSLYVPGRIEPWPLAWDGASVPYYVNNWDGSTDYTVWSPQIEAMNWIFMLEEVRQLNPEFRFEMSTWDGNEEGKSNDKRKYYGDKGQAYGPERYQGTIQFGMWLLRPRVVREFRSYTDTLAKSEQYFLSIVNSVDRVHKNPILRKFWRKGRLVVNPVGSHPYQSDVPEEYKKAVRWYLLDADVNPKGPLSLNTELAVFSLALVVGEAPEREWLVYAHSPLRKMDKVKIDLPGYGPVVIDVGPSGCFNHAIEKDRSLEKVQD